MEDKLMDIKETAVYLKMNKMTVYKLARENKIPAFRIASEWRFKKELIDQWLMNQLKDKGAFADLVMKRPNPDRSILVVDDDELTREFFKRMLNEYKVLSAASGEEAMYSLRREKVDLVLLDLKMPGMDGVETLRQIKKLNPDLDVIMISAHGTLKTTIEAASLGAIDTVAKPFDLEEMKSVIVGALERKPEPKAGNPHTEDCKQGA